MEQKLASDVCQLMWDREQREGLERKNGFEVAEMLMHVTD